MRDPVVVTGLGYVGLPLAATACAAGLRVTGLDVDDDRVATLNAGRSPIDDIDDGDVLSMLDAGFTATTDPACLDDASVAVICVPTPLRGSGEPDLGHVENATETIGNHLHEGMLVVLESTTYPGTTENVLRPLLEKSGLIAGADFGLAFSPERVDPGNNAYGIANTPKIVGGLTPSCRAAAMDFYGSFVDQVVPVGGLREAEMAKLLENTYRQVNIALVNEFALLCDQLEIDVWDVIAAASTKPFGFQPFYPGPGVGGHCIPVDPTYLSYCARQMGRRATLAECAQAINDSMPGFVLRRIRRLLRATDRSLKGARVLLIGVTFKADVADQRGAPAAMLAALLRDAGAHVSYHDPLIPQWRVGDRLLRSAPLKQAASADVVVVLEHHRTIDFDAVEQDARLVLDTRGRLAGPRTTRL
jgi:UDP-N-acetyl-D-glucosamine dehydrogenase